MGWADSYIKLLKQDEVVKFRSHGNSMVPIIYSDDLATTIPATLVVKPNIVVGGVVLCKVKGIITYLHLVKAIEHGRFLIGNNKGGTNGWTPHVFGKVVAIEK